MSAIGRLFNRTIEVRGRTTGPDDPTETDEENHPIESDGSPVLLATTKGAIQERSAREQASLINIGAVASTHRVYMITPVDQYGDPVRVDESRTLYSPSGVNMAEVTLSVVSVRDGGGRGDHLEIDATEYAP